MTTESTHHKNGKILLEAYRLLNGERQSQYGNPGECFGRVAEFWSVYLAADIFPEDVACMMILLKLARQANGHKADNLVDMAGYAALAADLIAARKQESRENAWKSGNN